MARLAYRAGQRGQPQLAATWSCWGRGTGPARHRQRTNTGQRCQLWRQCSLSRSSRPAHTHTCKHTQTHANTHRGDPMLRTPFRERGRIHFLACRGSHGDSTQVDTPHTSWTQTHSTHTHIPHPSHTQALIRLCVTLTLSPFLHLHQARSYGHITRVQTATMVFTQNHPVAP